MMKKELLPMKLQFFAEDVPEPTPTPAPIETEPTPTPTPTEQDADHADYRLKYVKMKKEFDKLASDYASTKKQLNSKLSESEAIALEKAEKEAQFQEEFENLKKENAKNKAEKSFLSIGYPADLALKAAEAQVSGDNDLLLKYTKEYTDQLVAKTKAEIYKDIPNPKSGTEEDGKQVPSIEAFKKMGVTERTQFKQQFPKTYETYMGR